MGENRFAGFGLRREAGIKSDVRSICHSGDSLTVLQVARYDYINGIAGCLVVRVYEAILHFVKSIGSGACLDGGVCFGLCHRLDKNFRWLCSGHGQFLIEDEERYAFYTQPSCMLVLLFNFVA